MLAVSPVTRLSMQITRCPSATSRSQRCDPRNPAPPVTTLTRSRSGMRRPPADAEVREAHLAEDARIIDVAAVEDDVPAHERLHLREVGSPELVPLGHDDEGVGSPEGVVILAAVGDLRAEVLLRLLHGDRIVDEDLRLVAEELAD